ncbi:FAD binding domain-containing protein [Ktedonospora formicarum]|uniref:Dehydrogenase n=1 Tax=Ktedonospora formicarum TaxID=2778364 RepID=A0A8J3I890_9CHLR|nr:xanthine dehydrogenase family protein subunit M [Ktedonospora formicarum]GHO46509.1 dehydrogenase [Ktedonospora formicarum]
MMWQNCIQPTSLPEALELVRRYGASARIVAGGTDVLVELQRGVKPTQTLIDVSALPDLKYVRLVGNYLTLGALATHNDVLRSSHCRNHAPALVQACSQVGAPQIRARATIAGNLLTASPANDTIPPLLALDAELVLVNERGERNVPLSRFYQGVRKTELQTDEFLREIRIPLSKIERRSHFFKLGLRRAQAISVVNAALVLMLENNIVSEARIALGCVAPTVVRATHVETFLIGKHLDTETCHEAAQLVERDCSPSMIYAPPHPIAYAASLTYSLMVLCNWLMRVSRALLK